MRGQIVVAFVAGLCFASGLALSGMTQPQNILAFLDVEHWNPALLFVMLGAIAVYGIGYRLVVRRSKPILTAKFEIPTRRDITFELVGGAALFGIGWGLGGYCGGPAIASLATGHAQPLVFVCAMFIGFLAFRGFNKSTSGAAGKAGQNRANLVNKMEHS